MAFSENIEIINISNLNKVTDLALDDIIIVNDVSESESKIIDLDAYITFQNKNLELNQLKDVAIGGGVGRELRRGNGIVWNGSYWVNEPIVEEAPLDGGAYLRQGGDWLLATESGVQSVQALAGLENIGSESVVKLQVDQNWFDVRYAQRGSSISATDITVTNSDSLSERGRLEYDNRGNFTYYPVDSSDFLTLETLPPESDPLFMASAAGSIRFIDVQNWNTAYSWGDHAQAGYVRAEDLVLNSLNDVNVANMQDGHVIKWSANSQSWYNGEGGLGKLGDMYDVNTAGTQDNWGLLYDAASEFWVSAPILLEKLTDVKVEGVSPGDYLGWDGDNWVNVGQDDVSLDIVGGLGINSVSYGPTTYVIALDAVLNNLNDCVVGNPKNGEYLRYYNGTWLATSGEDFNIPTVNNTTITLKAGSGMTGGGSFTLNQSTNKVITFNASGGGGDGAFYSLETAAGNSGNAKIKLNSTQNGDSSQITVVAGPGISISDIGESRFTINGIPGEASVPNLQQVLDKGNTADKNIRLRRNIDTPDETGVLLSSRGFIELADEEGKQPHIQFRNAIGGNDDYDWEIRQQKLTDPREGGNKLYIRYDNPQTGPKSTMIIGNTDVKFGDAMVDDGVRIGYRGHIEIIDESSGTPDIEFRNQIGGKDNFDWRLQQIGRTFNIDHDKDSGIHSCVSIKSNNTTESGTIILGESRKRDGMDVLVYGDLYDDPSYAHPMMGAKIWGTVSNKGGDQGRIKMGSKRKNGNYNFSAQSAGDGRVKLKFSPDLKDNDYCIMVCGWDSEGDHMFGVSRKEKDSVIIYSKDLENYDDATGDEWNGNDNCDELFFTIFFLYE